MKVLLTGATGFVGTYVTEALLDAGHEVRALVRAGSEGQLNMADRVEIAHGDITDPASLPQVMEGIEAVVHLVGIIEEKKSKGVTFERIHVEGTRNVVSAARASGVQRFVHMSANGARPGAPSRYLTTKWEAEDIVRTAGFHNVAVFAPSILFGDPGEGRPEFASQLYRTLIKPFPILPILGDGKYLLQPIGVREVAKAFAKALDLEGAGHRFCAAGPEALTFNEVVDRISRGAGISPKRKVHQPLFLARALVNTAGRAGLLPISPAQFEMLLAGNVCDPAAFNTTFEPARVPFTPEHLGYVADRA
ncbi:complex I NDUFA9 subunit family protein [soil metagenome]